MYYFRNFIKIKRIDYNVDFCINLFEFKFKCLIWENKFIYYRFVIEGNCVVLIGSVEIKFIY